MESLPAELLYEIVKYCSGTGIGQTCHLLRSIYWCINSADINKEFYYLMEYANLNENHDESIVWIWVFDLGDEFTIKILNKMNAGLLDNYSIELLKYSEKRDVKVLLGRHEFNDDMIKYVYRLPVYVLLYVEPDDAVEVYIRSGMHSMALDRLSYNDSVLRTALECNSMDIADILLAKGIRCDMTPFVSAGNINAVSLLHYYGMRATETMMIYLVNNLNTNPNTNYIKIFDKLYEPKFKKIVMEKLNDTAKILVSHVI